VELEPRKDGSYNSLSSALNYLIKNLQEMRGHVQTLKDLIEERVFYADGQNVPINCLDDAEVSKEVVVFAEVKTPFIIRPLNLRPN
jgi:hypothetical protein